MLVVPASGRAQEPGFKVVIHKDNPTGSMSRDDVSKLFLKQVRRWDGWKPDDSKNDVLVLPVDQKPNSPVREVFSSTIHGRKVLQIERFWQKQIFSGKDKAPATAESDAAVLAFVRARRGAVGYVAADADLGADVKELELNDVAAAAVKPKNISLASAVSSLGVKELKFKSRMIVNKNNPTDSLAREQIADFFLKKVRVWDGWNRQPVLPIDNQILRRSFVVETFGNPKRVTEYWRRWEFKGRQVEPPPIASSDIEVMDFVGAHPGAVGYVAVNANLGDDVKTLSTNAPRYGGRVAGDSGSYPKIKVIVHQDNPHTSMSRDEISDLFLQKLRIWRDWETAVLPVDQEVKSPVRQRFSSEIHGWTAERIHRHWQAQVFSGEDPGPPIIGSDAAVVAFVRANRGAIGYVTARTDLAAGAGISRVE